MKVFLAGGTGALGRYVLPALVEAGHSVTALARSDAKADWCRERGADPVQVSLFDQAALSEAFTDIEAVVNIATHVPPVTKAARAATWHEHDRIRSEGSAAIAGAALATDVQRYVQEGIAFNYPSSGTEWIDESTELDPSPLAASAVDAERSTQRVTEAGRVGVALRFGQFYGPENDFSDFARRMAERHIALMMGRKQDYYPYIHLADAATAVVAALDADAGIYNIVDDDPLTKAGTAAALGEAVGTKPWVHTPGRLARFPKGNPTTRSLRVSNAKFKQATGWTPRFPSVREGWQDIVSS